MLEGLRQFKAIIVIDTGVPEMTQWEICRWLVSSGCLYALAWGPECSAWEEAVEEAVLEAVNYEDVPEEQRVLTTSHEEEELSEAFWFAKHRAVHPANELRETLILHIAEASRREEIEAEYRDA